MNAIRAIHPFRYEGLWVFDDETVGLRQEPFVSGALRPASRSCFPPSRSLASRSSASGSGRSSGAPGTTVRPTARTAGSARPC